MDDRQFNTSSGESDTWTILDSEDVQFTVIDDQPNEKTDQIEQRISSAMNEEHKELVSETNEYSDEGTTDEEHGHDDE